MKDEGGCQLFHNILPDTCSDWLIADGGCGNSNCWLLCWRVVSVLIVHCRVKRLGNVGLYRYSTGWLYDVATDWQSAAWTCQLREIETWAKPYQFRLSIVELHPAWCTPLPDRRQTSDTVLKLQQHGRLWARSESWKVVTLNSSILDAVYQTSKDEDR